MALAMVMNHSYGRVHSENSAPRSQNTATRAEEEVRVEARSVVPGEPPPPWRRARSTTASTTTACRSSAGRGRLRSGSRGRRSGYSGTASRSSKLSCPFRFSMLLCHGPADPEDRPRHLVICRVGERRAQDHLPGLHPAACSASCGAARGVVGAQGRSWSGVVPDLGADGGLLVEAGHTAHPVLSFRMDSPPAKGGK